ncbi:MAG: MucB/RseB C-terminal domain-containing protein [Gammaproteobacteria bacterium]|nr:MucB/RseB C-terminal domain-containing protein [Gammaproteobacteria bacterium]
MIKRLLMIALLGSVIPGSVLAESVQSWINKMSSSSHQGNYQGTFVFWRDQKLEAMHISHGSKDGRIWVGLESLNGESRQLIHQNGEVTSIFPDKHLVSINEMTSNLPFHPDLPKDIKQLSKHYELTMLGQDRVASRETQVILVNPKDALRYGFKYWLDKDTGLMLRCDVFNEKKKVLEHMMFTDFEYLQAPPHEAFKQTAIPRNYKILKQDETQSLRKAGDNWFAAQLPEGFVLTKNILKPMRKKQDSVQQLVFSDGLASVSVFIDRNVVTPHRLDGHTSMGSVNAFGLMLGDHQVTAIGEAPLDTVKWIAKSIRHRQ